MSDAPALSSDAISTDASSGPPPIVVVKSEAGSTTFSYANAISGRVRGLVIFFIFMSVVMLLTGLQSKGQGAVLASILAFQAFFFLLFWIPALVRQRRHWRLDREAQAELSGKDQDRPTMVRGVLLEIGGLCRRRLISGKPDESVIGRFQQRLAELGLPTALVIVQADVEEALRAIHIDDAFVEPERVLAAMSRRSRSFWIQVVMLVCFIWILVSNAMQGQWFSTTMISFGVVVFAMQLLKSFGVHLSEANAPVMGMGVYVDHKDRRWSVLDSTVYIYPLKAGFQTLFLVELIGPAGHHAMVFHGVEDPGLIMFWQRWMHPHPRPDLV